MHLVIGATGNVGRQVTRLLVRSGHAVRALTRDPDRAMVPTGVEIVQGDLADPGTLAAAMKGVTKVYSLMRPGTAENLTAAALEAGVAHIVLLTSMAAESGGTPLAQEHQHAEQVISESGLAWTFLRPTSFASNTLAWAPSIRAEGVVRAPFGGGLRSAVIDPADVAAVAVAALVSPEHQGKILPLTGPEALSVVDQVRILTESLGRDIAFAEQTIEEARAEMVRYMPPQVVDGLLAGQRAAKDTEPRLLCTVEQVTGRPAGSYRDWVGNHLAEFA